MQAVHGTIEDFTGRNVLVTGGSTGIGRMIAEGFAASGASVIICARDQARYEAAAAEINAQSPGSCTAVQADLTSLDGIRTLAGLVSSRFSALHALVNNAGVVNVQPLESYTEEGWDETVDINMKAVFFVVQQMLPLLQAAATPARPAAVINIGSIGGMYIGRAENYAYMAAKAGAHHLTTVLARRLAAENITVNAIAPGVFPSEIVKREVIDKGAEDQFLQDVPLKRFGEARDIAPLAQFLASSYATFMTGSIIAVDGGMRLGLQNKP